MSNLVIFLVGLVVTSIWGATVGILMWAGLQDGRDRNKPRAAGALPTAVPSGTVELDGG